MPEVYRVLFEVFGMDPEAEDCQPKLRRQLEDVDYVSVEFEGRKLSWQDVASYRVSFIHLLVHMLSMLSSRILCDYFIFDVQNFGSIVLKYIFLRNMLLEITTADQNCL